jgi:hypothetical protein
MKKLLLILLCVPLIGLSQKTYVPDDNFENYLEANSMGDGIALNDSVFTSAIATVTGLDVGYQNIADLTGIEDFAGLMYLNCSGNQLTSLDISTNTALTDLNCFFNQLTSLDVSANTNLIELWCSENQLISLDVSTNISLTFLACDGNQLTSLDVSDATTLNWLYCEDNQLISLDVRNGNNINISTFYATNNPNLSCISADDVAWSTVNWTVANGNIDSWTSFSANCSSVPYDCTDSLEVTDVIIDNTNLTMNIAIYNGYNSYLSMPYVAFTIDANGDTIQQGNMNSFGVYPLDTSWYNYSLSSAITPAYPLTMYFVYVVNIGGSVIDTCILTYNSTPTAITDISVSSNRKLISIVDVLGRQNKGKKNEPLFYIYDDGTVEKKIILE